MYECRTATAIALLLAATPVSTASSAAQGYPARPVRYLVADTAGSGSDTIARIVNLGLTPALGQQVVVDNRPGATGTIGADMVAKAPTDGYTILQISSALAAAMSIYRNPPFDLLRDFEPVTQLAAAPQVAVVHPSVPVKTMKELASLAKSKPGELRYGSAGNGSSTHLAAELFKSHAGIDMLHVPYRGGGAAITAVVAGETQVYFAPAAVSLPHIKQGRLRALGVTTAKRLPLMPDLATIAEAGFGGFQTAQWYGVLVPKGTPKGIVATIRARTAAALQDPEVGRRLTGAGYIVIGDQPAEFGAHLRSEVERLGALVRRLGLKAG
ncbi:MAG: tripartite tricarboxylate transporter substrate binding protein [Burkholderiales bacterium]|nr:tripartite tricarboxylate transporter substrate binding protein [Burkholderiales bacterium]